MSLYEARLERDLKQIQAAINEVAVQVDHALQDARRAVLLHEKELAYQTILADHPINRASRNIDRLCNRFIALHLPSAGHLRYISSVLRLNLALERVGDYAVTICREVVQLTKPLEGTVRREVERIADDAIQMHRQAMLAYKEQNVELAKGTMGTALQVRRAFKVAFDDLAEAGAAGVYPFKDLFAILIILHRLNRVGDQSKNICEEAVFAATGQTKQAKVYRVVFLDDHNDQYGPMAVAIARKLYPDSGRYITAGRSPASTLRPELTAFLEQRGFETEDLSPTGITWAPESWDDHHVIVALQGAVEEYMDEVPFHTVALNWNMEAAAPAEAEAEAQVEAEYRTLAEKISTLMETLRGEDAP